MNEHKSSITYIQFSQIYKGKVRERARACVWERELNNVGKAAILVPQSGRGVNLTSFDVWSHVSHIGSILQPKGPEIQSPQNKSDVIWENSYPPALEEKLCGI